jgi:hypothetical protein
LANGVELGREEVNILVHLPKEERKTTARKRD